MRKGVRWAGFGFGLASAAVLAVISAMSPAVAQPRVGVAEMQARSAEIARNYLANWSADGPVAMASVPNLYGSQVRFYGRNLSYAGLEAEKRRAIERWPVRSYTLRPGTMTVVCNDSTSKCAVRAVVDYRVEDRRGRVSTGATTFDLGVGFAGSRPVVLYEDGRVLGRVR